MTVGAVAKKQSNFSRILTGIWDEFVYGGHLLSVSDASMVLAIIIILDKPVSWQLVSIAYLIPQTVYSLNHMKELKVDKRTNPERVLYLERTIRIYPFVVTLYIVLLVGFLLYLSNLSVIILVLFIGLAGILYPKEITKKIVGFKNYYVGLFSAAAACLLPCIFYRLTNSSMYMYLCLFIFLRLFLNTIYFDIKDYDSDKERGLKTIAVYLGIKKTVLLLSIINIVSGLVIIGLVLMKMTSYFTLGLAFVSLYSFIYLRITDKLNGPKLRQISYLMVDGEYIFWPIFLLIFKVILG